MEDQCFASIDVTSLVYKGGGASSVTVDERFESKPFGYSSSMYDSVEAMPDEIDEDKTIYYLDQVPCDKLNESDATLAALVGIE